MLKYKELISLKTDNNYIKLLQTFIKKRIYLQKHIVLYEDCR